MKIITQKKLNEITERITGAIMPVADELGIDIKAVSALGEKSAATVTIAITAREALHIPRDADAENFIRYAPLIGMSAEDLGRPVTLDGVVYYVVGYYPGQRKRPMLLRAAHGNDRYRVSIDAVRTALKTS